MNRLNSNKAFFFSAFFSIVSCFFLSLPAYGASPKVLVGADQLFNEKYIGLLKGKKIGLITNHTAVNRDMISTIDLLKAHASLHQFELKALYAPEHGINGAFYASEQVADEKDKDGIPIFSLHGKTKRLTKEMVKGIDIILYDIQDIGSRSYTYVTTLFYAMEEAAKFHLPVIVLDRPNPINGHVIDGPLLEEEWRSLVGYVNVPYCHGMTVAELANYFNQEYRINCQLTTIPMKGWKRAMTYADTGLPWVPTSPNIPEASTAMFYPMTGLLGELMMVNIGIGYTLPFKLVGAPWIDAIKFANSLNQQRFPGVYFRPFYYRPHYGKFAHEDCQGVLIMVTDPLKYKPVSTQFLLIGILKSLYPKQFKEAFIRSKQRKEMFCKVSGTAKIYRTIEEESSIVWKLRAYQNKEQEEFRQKRLKYLITFYD